MQKNEATRRPARPKKVRVLFCWDCGLKLRGGHHVVIVDPIDQMEKTLHKACAERLFPEQLYLSEE